MQIIQVENMSYMFKLFHTILKDKTVPHYSVITGLYMCVLYYPEFLVQATDWQIAPWSKYIHTCTNMLLFIRSNQSTACLFTEFFVDFVDFHLMELWVVYENNKMKKNMSRTNNPIHQKNTNRGATTIATLGLGVRFSVTWGSAAGWKLYWSPETDYSRGQVLWDIVPRAWQMTFL